MGSQQVETILTQIQRLSLAEKTELVKRIGASLGAGSKAEGTSKAINVPNPEMPGLMYGKYAGSVRAESTEEDFGIAEWNADEDWVNGN